MVTQKQFDILESKVQEDHRNLEQLAEHVLKISSSLEKTVDYVETLTKVIIELTEKVNKLNNDK